MAELSVCMNKKPHRRPNVQTTTVLTCPSYSSQKCYIRHPAIPDSVRSEQLCMCLHPKVEPDCWKWLFTYLTLVSVFKYLNTHTSRYFTSEVLNGFFLFLKNVIFWMRLFFCKQGCWFFFLNKWIWLWLPGSIQNSLLSAPFMSEYFMCLRNIHYDKCTFKCF